MSSLERIDRVIPGSKRKKVGYKLRFQSIDKSKQNVWWLGYISRVQAEEIKMFVEDLLASHRIKSTPKTATQEWIDSLPAKSHSKLVAWGLCEERQGVQDSERIASKFFEGYISSRHGWDRRTADNYRQATTWFFKLEDCKSRSCDAETNQENYRKSSNKFAWPRIEIRRRWHWQSLRPPHARAGSIGFALDSRDPPRTNMRSESGHCFSKR